MWAVKQSQNVVGFRGKCLGGSVAIHKHKEGSWTVTQRMQHMRDHREKDVSFFFLSAASLAFNLKPFTLVVHEVADSPPSA